MATRRTGGPTVSSGRRGFLRYAYGNHYWVPDVQADWSHGMVRDTARDAIPAGSVYDSADFLLHQPGVAQKRGGTSYAGPALTGASYTKALAHVPFSAGAQLLAVGSNNHLFKVTAGTTTDIGALGGSVLTKMQVAPGANYELLPFAGAANAQKYDGTTISTLDTALGLSHLVIYKSRVVGSDAATKLNRLVFSPVPDVNATWDTANSWIDTDNQISGLAALNNALLIFSANGMERIIGATPPPNSDMDRAPISPIGCTDCRSITQVGPYVYFANPEGVYFTNGSTPVSLTEQGGIATYWRNLFASGYVTAAPVPGASTSTIATGFLRGFLFVTVLDTSQTLLATLMCNVARRAWWRLTNVKALAYATSVDGTELYYANADTNRVSTLSGIFSPTAANKNDADGTAVLPVLEFAPSGTGVGVKSYGFGRLDYDLRDAASDNPSLEVDLRVGIEGDTTIGPLPESPLVETTTLARKRFSVCRDAQSISVLIGQQNASSKTEIYALEVESRPRSLVGDGIS